MVLTTLETVTLGLVSVGSVVSQEAQDASEKELQTQPSA